MTEKKPVAKQRHYNRSAKNEKDHVEKLARQQRALELRIAGMTYSQIGDAIGVNRATAYKYYRDALAELLKENVDTMDELRTVELAKLDRRERAAMQVLTDIQPAYASNGKIVVDIVPPEKEGKPPTTKKLKDYQTVLQAVGKLNDIASCRAKLLGLNAPQKIEQSGSVEVTTAQHPDLSVLTDEEYTAWKAANAKLRASMEGAQDGEETTHME